MDTANMAFRCGRSAGVPWPWVLLAVALVGAVGCPGRGAADGDAGGEAFEADEPDAPEAGDAGLEASEEAGADAAEPEASEDAGADAWEAEVSGEADAEAGEEDAGIDDAASGLEDGSPCLHDDDCRSGYCTDGVCCAERCDAACRTCRDAGVPGTCGPDPAGTDSHEDCGRVLCGEGYHGWIGDTCYRTRTVVPAEEVFCDGAGACQTEEAVCAAAGPGEPDLERAACYVAGGCTGSERASVYPVDAGEDPYDDCDDDGPGTCGRTGECDGGGGCAWEGVGTPCGEAVCAGGVMSPAPLCDGLGSCETRAEIACTAGCDGAHCAELLPDLDALFVERVPRYQRYKYCYEHGYAGDTNPYLCPENDRYPKHQPEAGETVTFIPHVANKGEVAADAFAWTFLIDGTEIANGTGSVGAHQRTAFEVPWTWDPGDHEYAFRVDPAGAVAEAYEQNNEIVEKTWARSFLFAFVPEYYRVLDEAENTIGTRSAEDWVRDQMGEMMRAFDRSTYPDAPDGILSRLRIDLVLSLPNSHIPALTAADDRPLDAMVWRQDGVWAFWVLPETASHEEILASAVAYEEGLHLYGNEGFDWGLIHEVGHQFGLADIYRMHVHKWLNFATDVDGVPFGVGHWSSRNHTVMGEPANWKRFSDTEAVSLNLTRFDRNGSFGGYLFCIPGTNRIRVEDPVGAPVSGAELAVFQQQPIEGGGGLRDPPEFTGVTDEDGEFPFPRPPFGTEINNWGDNATLFVRLRHRGQENFAWLEIMDFNLACLRGDAEYTALIRGKLVDAAVDRANRALGAAVSVAPGEDESTMVLAVDGLWPDGSCWAPWNAPGAWLQIDLGRTCTLYRLRARTPAAAPYGMIRTWTVEVSDTGAFAGEQQVVVDEPDWWATVWPGNEFADYVFPPRTARYVRLLPRELEGCLYELEVYALAE